MNDLRGAVVVNLDGVLALITSITEMEMCCAIRQDGSSTVAGPHPIVLGFFIDDFFASGRTFQQWCRDRGYHGPIHNETESIFLVKAQSLGRKDHDGPSS